MQFQHQLCFQAHISFDLYAAFGDIKCLYFEGTAAIVFSRFSEKMGDDGRKDCATSSRGRKIDRLLLMAPDHIILTV